MLLDVLVCIFICYLFSIIMPSTIAEASMDYLKHESVLILECKFISRQCLIQGKRVLIHIMMKHLDILNVPVKIEQKKKEREEVECCGCLSYIDNFANFLFANFFFILFTIIYEADF